MTTSPPLERKVRQLDNDVQALYELIFKISATQVRHTNRFDELSADVAAHGERLDGLEGKVDRLEGKVDGLDGKVDTILDLLQQR